MYGLTLGAKGAYGMGVAFVGLHLHFLFGMLLVFGLVMLGVWASNNLKKGALKKFAIWFMVVGLLGMILGAGLCSWKFHRWDDDKDPLGLKYGGPEMVENAVVE